MTRRAFATALFALSTSLPAAAQEEKAAALVVRELVDKYVAPDVARDRKALESLFTTDVDHLDADGSFCFGRDAVVGHIFESARKNPARRWLTIRSTHPVGVHAIMFDGEYHQVGNDREIWATITVRWTPDGWRISAVRIFVPVAPVKFQ
jgi:hypothetical protein